MIIKPSYTRPSRFPYKPFKQCACASDALLALSHTAIQSAVNGLKFFHGDFRSAHTVCLFIIRSLYFNISVKSRASKWNINSGAHSIDERERCNKVFVCPIHYQMGWIIFEEKKTEIYDRPYLPSGWNEEEVSSKYKGEIVLSWIE